MSPTYTMSAHLCKTIVESWRQTRHSSPEASPLPSPPSNTYGSYFPRSTSSSSLEKRSMDGGERQETSPLPRPASNWRWGGKSH
ncbi:hypothetical protein QBC42DRAFT_177026 [Cladorrhinum samala]|uniref:Uncharacterized protein n=1 Tax=Cladorrhinum samala TaxID=585594 RepID=A0AAV9HST4_9PEZI|nr:hypothetical protein QBC42DRAFT_177026 [Cladorrhinum samala]